MRRSWTLLRLASNFAELVIGIACTRHDPGVIRAKRIESNSPVACCKPPLQLPSKCESSKKNGPNGWKTKEMRIAMCLFERSRDEAPSPAKHAEQDVMTTAGQQTSELKCLPKIIYFNEKITCDAHVLAIGCTSASVARPETGSAIARPQ